ncbi:hypothetical protein [Sporosarcina sp. FSL W7-1283]|uniref:hypothetical protein n=1 Tax=Sporosarcina sp. FSL W7-1283 TaxID=2921560 RepID=UPI0030FCC514
MIVHMLQRSLDSSQGSRIEGGVYLPFSELIELIKQQPDIFHAMAAVQEINEMNNYELIGAYDIKKIKQYYKENKGIKEVVNTYNKNNSRDNHITYRDLQKAYMKLLSK